MQKQSAQLPVFSYPERNEKHVLPAATSCFSFFQYQLRTKIHKFSSSTARFKTTIKRDMFCF